MNKLSIWIILIACFCIANKAVAQQTKDRHTEPYLYLAGNIATGTVQE